ncbi:hypothetical protein ABZX51_000396 [Aspergillus tubingensis]
MKIPLWALVALPFTTALVFPFHHNPLPEHDDNSITVTDENINPDLINGITTTLATALGHLTTDIYPTIVNNYLNYNPSDSSHPYAQHVSDLAPPFRHPTPPPYLRHPASNKTLYDLILSNPDTSILAHFIRNDHQLTTLLRNTSTNLTFFAPTDEAFRKLHHHHHYHEHNTNTNNNNYDKETHARIHHILTYHTVKGSYPIDKLFQSPTVPTYIHTEHSTLPQRITVRPITTRDLMLNFHSRIISLDKHASNGILYHIDSVLMPPPSTLTILNSLPSEFSTFTLALYRTGLDRVLTTNSDTNINTITSRALKRALHLQSNDETQSQPSTSSPQTKPDGNQENEERRGLTLLLPPNPAFVATFTPEALTFLFSPEGGKYLSAIIKYHIVVGEYRYLRINGYQGVLKAGELLTAEGNMFVLSGGRVLVPPKRGNGREDGGGYLMGVEEVRERVGGWLGHGG